MFTIIILQSLYCWINVMQGICEEVINRTNWIPKNIWRKLMQHGPSGLWFNSSQVGCCVFRLFISLCLLDSVINSLCHHLIEAQKKWSEAINVSIFYITGHIHPGAVAPLPITIQVLPGATNKEVLDAFKNEKQRLIENAKTEERACCDRQTLLEKELEEKMLELMNKVLCQKHEPGSPAHALKHVIETAKAIKVVANEEDEDDNQVDEKSLEVIAFVEACEKALLIIIP